jgi:hypothetical protein
MEVSMDNEQELAAIFKELNRENQAYLLLEAQRSRNAEKAGAERDYGPHPEPGYTAPPLTLGAR